MKWFCPMMVFVIIAMKCDSAEKIKSELSVERTNDMGEQIHEKLEVSHRSHIQKHRSYSNWESWGDCLGGWKTRRRHCIRHHICGDALRVEVARCKHSSGRGRPSLRQKTDYSQRQKLFIQTAEKRSQPPTAAVQRHFRGFLPWSEWSNCSRRCTTIRIRHCLKRSICGRKVIRQSAYCYLEGSYCQYWIRNRMQTRQDPDQYSSSVVESMPLQALGVQPEHFQRSRIPEPSAVPECGKLGQYRGNAGTRFRYRMRDMVRIIGGRPAPPGKWPWQVAVLNRFKEPFCGGTLIGLRWVVTAAHCVRRRMYVRLGEHDLLLRNREEVEMRVTEAITHPYYNSDTVINDVALLRLPSSARPDLGHGIACLPLPRYYLPPHSSCVILGWGKKRPTDTRGTRLLHEAQVSTIQQGVCRRTYWEYAITDDMTCAGRGRRDSCAGDSGGPLLCQGTDHKYYLQGITSFGDGCGKRGKYGIYTRTAGYVTWMREVMSQTYFD